MTEKQIRNAAEMGVYYGLDMEWMLSVEGYDRESIDAVLDEMERLRKRREQ